MRTLSEAQAKACAYHLVDVIETKARALMAREPGLDLVNATVRVITGWPIGQQSQKGN